MQNKGLLDGKLVRTSSSLLLGKPVSIAERGWQMIEAIETARGEHSRRAFVAMWFHNSTDLAAEKTYAALKSLGFTPVRIDRKEHNNEISGEILYEIARSRFIVADVTGQRQGVYFEAGFAMGLKVPVIWTCRSDEIDKVHFDTRQYNHIVWKDEEDLLLKLVNRIKGTILL